MCFASLRMVQNSPEPFWRLLRWQNRTDGSNVDRGTQKCKPTGLIPLFQCVARWSIHKSMNKLVIANLLHRPLRSLISITAVAIEFMMILSIVGIFMGMLNDQKQRTNGIGADLMMRASNASIMNGVSGATIEPENRRCDQQACLMLLWLHRQTPHLATVGSVEILYGIDYDSFDALKPFVFSSGGRFQGPKDAIVDDVFANSANPHTGNPYAVGDSIEILNSTFRISGIFEHGKGGRKLIPLATMDEMTGTRRKGLDLLYQN